MRQRTKITILRKALVLTFLAVGLVIVGTDKRVHVNAVTCGEAFDNYINADNAYEIARYSYFYGSPTTCQQDCQNSQNPTQCVNDCQTTRYTALGAAEIGMFSAANGTCTPLTLDECAQARAMANNCLNELNSSSYSTQEELDAILTQYGACLTASKVDTCQ